VTPAWPTAPAAARPSAAPRLVAALALVVVLAVAGWFVFLRGDDGGAGTFHATVDADRPAGAHHVRIPAGSVALVTVTPADGFDAVVGFAVSGDDADAVERAFRRTGFAEAATPTPVVDGADVPEAEDRQVFTVDVGFPGEQELTFLAATGAGAVDADVVVSGFDAGDGAGPSTGEYDVTIRIVGLDLGDDDDGRDVIHAMEDHADVPEEFVELVRSTIETD
jgi:hypothetical protein